MFWILAISISSIFIVKIMDIGDISDWKCITLKEELKKLGLKVSGNKHVLYDRLANGLQSQSQSHPSTSSTTDDIGKLLSFYRSNIPIHDRIPKGARIQVLMSYMATLSAVISENSEKTWF